jgi:hypothetical protein
VIKALFGASAALSGYQYFLVMRSAVSHEMRCSLAPSEAREGLELKSDMRYGTIVAVSQSADRVSIRLDDGGYQVLAISTQPRCGVTGKLSAIRQGQRVSFEADHESGAVIPASLRVYGDYEQDAARNAGCEAGGAIESEVEWAEVNGYESRFGDRCLGIVVRDPGAYGSMPLYDDYDEGGPD